MIAIQLRFPTGKWHATPWGRQVNEGAVEWPPSHWRLLRALIAIWHRKFPDLPRDDVQRLIDALHVPPQYQLPAASQGHTRHYMKVGPDKAYPGGKPTLIFDTFVAISRESRVTIAWPNITLDSAQRELLGRMLRAMSYFGRAESWVDAQLVDDWEGEMNCRPIDERGVQQDEELVRILAPLHAEEFAHWRTSTRTQMEERLLSEKKSKLRRKGKPDDKAKLLKKEIESLNAALPETIFDALHVETVDIRNAGWSRPPGSQWVDYVRPRNAIAAKSPQRNDRSNLRRPHVARYAIASSVPPLLTDAVFIGERIRTAIMSCSRKVTQQESNNDAAHAAEVFSGKTDDGTRLTGHYHAHFLPEAKSTERRIRYVTIWAPRGFDAHDEAALSRLQRVWGDGGHDLQLVLIGIGDADDFGGFDERKGESPILARSVDWVSRTPFVPTDHLKIRKHEMREPEARAAAEQRELESVIRKELRRRDWLQDYADEVRIQRVPHTWVGGTQTSWLKFRRERHKGNGARSSASGYGFRLTFPEPVQGPIALGYGSHFGLGTFTPVIS